MNINSGWEKREDRSICRWMLVWIEAEDNCLLGAVAGYSGGGSFQLEMFYATHDGTELTSLLIDLEDKISNKEIDFFTDVSEESQELCSKCEDVILDWINIEAWEDAEQLLLENRHNETLKESGDLLLFSNASSKFAKVILENAGITASPTE